tara:strand:+ start:195 stop:611 length:417 start_codon:yes stop_codon:yes gene_type:complete
MRHKKSGRKLNRNSSHRKALMKNLAIAFIERELIKTTVAKAKELRSFIEPLITMAKHDSVTNRRIAFNKLRLDSAVNKLFTEISIKSKDRPGGYIRIIKAGFRSGDKADMAYVEWVDRDLNDSNEMDEPELKESLVSS